MDIRKEERRSSISTIAMHIVYTIVYIVVLVPLFMFGGGLLWAGGNFIFIGMLLSLYSISCCLILFKVWLRPDKTI